MRVLEKLERQGEDIGTRMLKCDMIISCQRSRWSRLVVLEVSVAKGIDWTIEALNLETFSGDT